MHLHGASLAGRPARAELLGDVEAGVTFVQEFHAREDRSDELRSTLLSLLPTIRQAPGCRFCQLLQSEDDPRRFLVCAVWESRQAHEEAVRHLPSDRLRKAMTLVADMPRGGVWVERD